MRFAPSGPSSSNRARGLRGTICTWNGTRAANGQIATASRVPYQLQIIPRAPRARFEDNGPLAAGLLHATLGRLSRALGALPPLNLWVRTAPRGAQYFCWRIDVMPRLTHLAGLELGTGLHLNILPPERAAELLKAA